MPPDEGWHYPPNARVRLPQHAGRAVTCACVCASSCSDLELCARSYPVEAYISGVYIAMLQMSGGVGSIVPQNLAEVQAPRPVCWEATLAAPGLAHDT